jgi:hypothetical protein
MNTPNPLTIPRPATLNEVAVRTREGEPFDPLLREFLDTFYVGDSSIRTAAIAVAPLEIDPLHDVYLAAVAEHLARKYELAIPPWVDSPQRFLEKPFFAGGLESLKAILLVESPLAFRRRQIFVSANALSRPRENGARSR